MAENSQATISLTPEQLKDLIATSVATAIAESKKPTEEELEKRAILEKRVAKKKEYWRTLINKDRRNKEMLQEMCTHIHPEENKSLIWKFPIQNCNGGMVLTCSRCRKQFRNFETQKNSPPKLITDMKKLADFNKWFSTPSIMDRGLVG